MYLSPYCILACTVEPGICFVFVLNYLANIFLYFFVDILLFQSVFVIYATMKSCIGHLTTIWTRLGHLIIVIILKYC